MQTLEQQKTLSKSLAKTIAEQRTLIADNKQYLHEQEQLIKDTLEVGNNRIHELTTEADELGEAIYDLKAERLEYVKKVDDKRFELLNMS